MQVYQICMIFIGLVFMLNPDFSLAQDSQSAFADVSDRFQQAFTETEIRNHINAVDAFEKKLDEAIPTENGEYLVDVNDGSLGGAVASSVFYRNIVLTGERNNNYVMRGRSGTRFMDSDLFKDSGLEDLAKEFEAGEVRIRLKKTPEGLLDRGQSYLQFHTG